MDKKQNLIPLQELNLTSRFLFDEVLEDPQIHQDVLGIIFQRDIPLLEKNETEKELRVSPLLRSIRMDVFSMDEEKAVYNTEMQQKIRAVLHEKRGLQKTRNLQRSRCIVSKTRRVYTHKIHPFE